MSNLIKIQTNDNLEQVISARELHEKLNIEKHFSQWWAYQTERLGLIEGKDFLTTLLESQGGRPGTDYLIPLDIAKHLCMISGGENAHAIRQYFIQVEKAWNSPEMVMSRALKLAERKIANLEEERLKLLPKAESYDILMDAAGCLTMNEVAKLLDIKGIGQNNLFKLLVVEKIIYKKGDSYLPYQEYKPHFIVKQNPVRKGGAIIERSQLFMTTRGVDWLAHKLIDRGYQVNYYKGKIA
jgi:anti-repressor protein